MYYSYYIPSIRYPSARYGAAAQKPQGEVYGPQPEQYGPFPEDFKPGGKYYDDSNDTASESYLEWGVIAAGVVVVAKTGAAAFTSGAPTIANIGTNFGKLGTLIENPGVTVKSISAHALERMNERGITQGMINAWVNTGKALQQAGNKIMYVTKEGVAVVNEAGKLITAYGSSFYDENMKAVIEQLFGK